MSMEHAAHEASAPTNVRQTAEDKRNELYRIIEELGTAREERAATLRARFNELWGEIGQGVEPTIH